MLGRLPRAPAYLRGRLTVPAGRGARPIPALRLFLRGEPDQAVCAGLTFWLRRNKFDGSYLALSAARRTWFAPYAALTRYSPSSPLASPEVIGTNLPLTISS